MATTEPSTHAGSFDDGATHRAPSVQPGIEAETYVVSATVADWSREAKTFFQWSPSRSLISCIRRYQRCAGRRTLHHYVIKKIAVLQHRFWSAVTGADIPLNTKFAGGLLMPHPNGIVIHPDSQIGPNCLLFQQVTLAGGPRLGGHVDVGAGAKIIGRVTIGDHAVIGANAVVVEDVPAGTTVVGIPARPVQRRQRDL